MTSSNLAGANKENCPDPANAFATQNQSTGQRPNGDALAQKNSTGTVNLGSTESQRVCIGNGDRPAVATVPLPVPNFSAGCEQQPHGDVVVEPPSSEAGQLDSSTPRAGVDRTA